MKALLMTITTISPTPTTDVNVSQTAVQTSWLYGVRRDGRLGLSDLSVHRIFLRIRHDKNVGAIGIRQLGKGREEKKKHSLE